MKNFALVITFIVLVGCQTTPQPPPTPTQRVIKPHHEVMARDLMSVWTTCSSTDAVTIKDYSEILTPLVRKTGRAIVENSETLFDLNYSYVALDQQGTAIVVLGQLKHPSCTVSRQYRVNLNKVTPEGSYGVVQ